MTIIDAIAALREHGGIIKRDSCRQDMEIWIDPASYREPKLFMSVRDRLRGFRMTSRWKPEVDDLIGEDWIIVEDFRVAAKAEASEAA